MRTGILAKKLMHPKYNIPKTYNVTLDKPLKKAEFTQIKKGFLLEDGFGVMNVVPLNVVPTLFVCCIHQS